jgi:hypothetical protein
MLAACDRQVDTHFQGDSLMRIQASVTIPHEFEGRDLIPVIGFKATSPRWRNDACWYTNQMSFVEVAVKGDFPSNFTLDVFDPPPPEALHRWSDGPAFGRGYVTAVPRRHEEGLITSPADEEMFQGWKDVNRETCYVEDENGHYRDKEEGRSCNVTRVWALDGKRYLQRHVSCDRPAGECDVVSSGDESLAAAGYSVNYELWYFAEPVQPGTTLANTVSGGKSVSAGYHLYRIHYVPYVPAPPDVSANTDPCLNSAVVYLDRYNAEHGTASNLEHFFPPVQPSLTLEERHDYLCTAQAHPVPNCSRGEWEYEEVGDERISIELGAKDEIDLAR